MNPIASRIVGGLWVGSRPPPGAVLYDHGIGTLVLCAKEWQPRSREFPGVQVAHAPIDDAELTSQELKIVRLASKVVASRLMAGQKVLVTCQQGRNRSAFVAAVALYRMTGLPGRRLIEIVRSRREPDIGLPVLSNPSFTAVLSQLGTDPRESALSWGDW